MLNFALRKYTALFCNLTYQKQNISQFEVAPERLLYAGYMKVAAKVDLVNLYCMHGTLVPGRLQQHHLHNLSGPSLQHCLHFPYTLMNCCSIAACSILRMRANARGCKMQKHQQPFASPFLRRGTLYEVLRLSRMKKMRAIPLAGTWRRQQNNPRLNPVNSRRGVVDQT